MENESILLSRDMRFSLTSIGIIITVLKKHKDSIEDKAEYGRTYQNLHL